MRRLRERSLYERSFDLDEDGDDDDDCESEDGRSSTEEEESELGGILSDAYLGNPTLHHRRLEEEDSSDLQTINFRSSPSSRGEDGLPRHQSTSPSSVASSSRPLPWSERRLHLSLSVMYALSSAATTVPVPLLPDLVADPSSSVSRVVLGSALGKFCNGHVADVLGARRTLLAYGALGALSLVALSSGLVAPDLACAAAEFFGSVQWPCLVNVLSVHHRHDPAAYERGVHATSLAARCGCLVALPAGAVFRAPLRLSAGCAAASVAVAYLAARDAPDAWHRPANPPASGDARALLLPSARAVLGHGTFWIVAAAHAGGSMVRSSERVLGTYYRDTNHDDAVSGGLVVSLSIGLWIGLAAGGGLFARSRDDSRRRRLVASLYAVAVACCYALALLAWSPRSGSVLRLWAQVAVTCVMGAGVAVPYYLVPPMVAARFGRAKGMYTSYTDGAAQLLSSAMWRWVGNAVERGSPSGRGWAYGWAFVALLVMSSGVLMVEFMDHYFVRRGGNKKDNAYLDDNGDAGERRSLLGFPRRWRRSGNDNGRPKHSASSSSLVPISLDDSTFEAKPPHFSLLDRTHHEDEDDVRTNEPPPSPHSSSSSSLPAPMEEVVFFKDQPPPPTGTSSDARSLSRRLEAVLDRPANRRCVDCSRPFPRWASLVVWTERERLVCLVCQECAGAHRRYAVVRSADHDSWTEAEVARLEQDDSDVNASHEAGLVLVNGEVDLTAKPHPGSDQRTREDFVRRKYKERAWWRPRRPTDEPSSSEEDAETTTTTTRPLHHHDARSIELQRRRPLIRDDDAERLTSYARRTTTTTRSGDERPPRPPRQRRPYRDLLDDDRRSPQKRRGGGGGGGGSILSRFEPSHLRRD